MKIQHQIGAFAGVGVFAAIAHYSVLIGAVELWHADPVAASLAGFVAGGVVSYLLNRRVTFTTSRSHAQAGWRFGVVAFGGFLATGLLMGLFVRQLALPYLVAQVITTLLVMLFTFTAHKTWSFGEGK